MSTWRRIPISVESRPVTKRIYNEENRQENHSYTTFVARHEFNETIHNFSGTFRMYQQLMNHSMGISVEFTFWSLFGCMDKRGEMFHAKPNVEWLLSNWHYFIAINRSDYSSSSIIFIAECMYIHSLFIIIIQQRSMRGVKTTEKREQIWLHPVRKKTKNINTNFRRNEWRIIWMMAWFFGCCCFCCFFGCCFCPVQHVVKDFRVLLAF